MTTLAADFERMMIADSELYRKITRTKPTAYLQMIARHGGVEAARRLISDSKRHEGFTRAWEHQCLHLTAEYLAVFGGDGAYQSLFSETDLAMARKKLQSLGVNGPV